MRKLLCLLLILRSSSIFAQPNHFSFERVPEWVKEIQLPQESKISKYDVMGGAYVSLFDEQRNLTEQSVYSHRSFKVLTSGGVQSVSEISIPYDTAYKQLHFHYLHIWRNGKKLDRTSELTFEFLRNESNLNQKVYTGMVTAYEILDDIRKDDVIEYAYTIIGENPIFDGKQFDMLVFEFGNPVDHVFYRMVFDENLVVDNRCVLCDEVEVSQHSENGMRVIELSKKNLAASPFEDSMPPWFLSFSHFTLTTFGTWEEVDRWAERVFDVDSSSQLNQLITQLIDSYQTLPEQIDAAINYVQDEIRYMGVENGIGSIKPFPPDKVIDQRYGDCKDKSLLLATILNQLGVDDAYPALVSSRLTKGVTSILPAGQVFDHCIVFFNYDGEEHWIDPTIPLQGGTFRNMSIPDYHVALVVGDSIRDLVKMNSKRTSRVEITEELTFADFEKPGFLYVTTKHFGLSADQMRSTLEYVSRKELSDSYRESYGRLFPGIQKDELVVIKDDELENVITTVETYFIRNPWQKIEYAGQEGVQFKYQPIEFSNYISQTECEDKKYPVYIPYPTELNQTTIVNLPEKLPVEIEASNFTNAAFNYSSKIIPISRTEIELQYKLSTLRDEVSPNEFKKVCSDMNEISRQIALTFNYGTPNINNENFRRALRQWNSPAIGY